MKKLTSKLVVALGLLAGYTIQMSTAAAQCCVTIPATNNTALINISVPWAINDDFTAADNSAVFVDQVLAPAPIPAGNYPGWCIDVPDNIGNGPTVYNTTLYSSCDSNLNSELPTNYPASVYVSPATWHTINYILNHRGTNYFWDVQNAIWYFIGGPVPAGLGPPTYPPTNPATVTAIVNDALTNAPSWQSQCGDVVAVIVAVNVLPHDQLTMIEVPCNCCSGEIGDYIWQDLNGNGCQDAGEPGIAGVKVDLYSGACGTTGTLVATTNTDSTGHYLFSGLCAGSYQVVITTPAGFTATKPNQGCTNPSLPPYENQLDSKCNCAGASPCVNCVTLTSGNLTNLNVDCGYVPQLSLQCSGGSGTVGVPYTFVLPVSGGCAPYTFSIISGALPGGLILNPSTGVITGTPTNSGTFFYVAQVKDSCGDTATTANRGCGITIGCACTPHDIQYNFNGTQIIFQPTAGGSYVWFISDGTVNGLPSAKTTLHITDQMITIPATGSSPKYTVPVPDSFVTFDPSVTVATTTFDTGANAWRITLPKSGLAGNVFYGGAAFKVPVAGLPGGIKNVDWTGSFVTATPGLTVHWQWHAAAYSNFTSNYNAIAAKPVDDNKASIYQTSDQSGTPEGTDPSSGKPWKNFVVGGASGGGGGNYTGSGSSTIQFPPCVCPDVLGN